MHCLFLIFVEPLRLVFEGLFFFAYTHTHNVGLSIVLLSLFVNSLILPLYNRADSIQREQQEREKKIRPMTDHIKKCFKGDERVMMLQTYYYHMSYSPLSSLNTSLSLILQIPFFIAAYTFLSGLKFLNGVPLGPISDLSMPDGLIKTGAFTLNALPILMTLINILSGFIYSEKGNIKEKIKLVMIALVFLLLLYNSPSALVFYWTLNNLFSLGKNIVYNIVIKKKSAGKPTGKKSPLHLSVVISCLILAVVTGLLIPSNVISNNPQEMVNTFITDSHSPALYIVSSVMISIGAFILWVPLFLSLLFHNKKDLLRFILPVLATTALINYVMFNKNFGLLSMKLTYEHPMIFGLMEVLTNILCNIAVAAAVVILIRRHEKIVTFILGACLFTVAGFSLMNMSLINKGLEGFTYTDLNTEEEARVPFTTTGKNVVVIMMDRMINGYIPYIFNERPDVAQQFEGFTYYPNTISFGVQTLHGAPSLYGGYDYTPYEINARSSELLVDKHNESLRVLPTIFASNGWNVTMADPPYANYYWLPDLSIYDDCEGVNALQLSGVFNDNSEILRYSGEEFETILNRNLFCYGFMKIVPYAFQSLLYAEGSYNYIDTYVQGSAYEIDVGQEGYIEGFGDLNTVQSQLFESFVQEYEVLKALDEITEVTDDPQNCFFMFDNCATHTTCLLQEPEYVPALSFDNTEYDRTHMDRFTVDGVTMNMESYLDYSHYECDMAACIALGNWFDYLRENGLYDNTRIILVSDHGQTLGQFDNLYIDHLSFDAESVNPILMVKDFGSNEFTVSYDFMTNADAPYLAAEGLIDNPVNPFTGNPLRYHDEFDQQMIFILYDFTIPPEGSTQFDENEGYWLTVRDNIFEQDNWQLYSE